MACIAQNSDVNATSDIPNAMQSYRVELEHKFFVVVVQANDDLELYVDNCLRKRCSSAGTSVLYVWTNIELHWEEHRFVEARLDRSTRRLRVTVNRRPVLEKDVPILR